MNISLPFIRRPVATTLLTAAIALAGGLAFKLLPVSALPQVDFPTISVTAGLPGASPETMAATVATPLERALGTIAGVSEITSSSSLSNTRITLQFDLTRDIDGAARDVQAAINASRALLPSGMPGNPTYRKVNPADAPVIILALTSKTMSRGEMYDAAATVLAQKISQLSGVGDVTVGGSSLPAVRVELNPKALDGLNLSPETVRTAIANANVNRPKGALEDGTRRLQITGNDHLDKAADYRDLVVSWAGGAAIRLRDVAQVSDSVQDLRNDGRNDGEPAVLLLVRRQPGANVIEVVDRITALLPSLQASIPAAIDLKVALDSTPTIRASVADVERSLVISVLLVIGVVFVFLRSARAALVPAVVVPVSLVGTFAAMYLAGFSLDNLSLMALTVATGFVVDDAVVVLENTMRHVDAGMPAAQAAELGAREVGFTVMAMSVSLVAVFIPILMMGGVVGRLFQEFALTMAVAIFVSLILSLTTTPSLCAQVLKPVRESGRLAPGRAGGRLLVMLERGYTRLQRGYERALDRALAHQTLVLMITLATIAASVWLYVAVPKGFLPQQDTGRLVGNIQADQSISFQAMQAKLLDFMRIVQADRAVAGVTGFTGGGQRNSANMFVVLKPRDVRDESADDVIARLRGALAHEPGARLFLQSAQDIRVGGRAGNAQYQYTVMSDELADLRAAEPRIRRALSGLPELADVSTDQQDKGLMTRLVVDRDSAARLGINMQLLDATLNDLFGQRQVSTIYHPLNQYHVVMEAAPEYWQSPSVLADVHFTTASGNAVPLAQIAHWEDANTPLAVNHQSGAPATTVAFNLAPGTSLSQAQMAIEEAMRKLALPPTVHGSFQGTARAFAQTTGNQGLWIAAAIAAVYIVLGVLYESWLHPITILSTIPSAGVGALLALLVTGTQFDVVALIGVLLLVGIVKKNAIMLVDFALEAQRRDGLAPLDAVRRAASLRLRPILMTTAAALLGALPLVLGHGEGSELRRPLGMAIVGGLLVSQLLTLFTTPVVHLAMARMAARAHDRRARAHLPAPRLAT